MAPESEEATASKTESKTVEKPSVEALDDVPDPDEDDLDDLDDMLDDFSAVKIDAKSSEAAAAGPGRPATTAAAPATSSSAAAAPGIREPSEDALADDDFAKQLQAGMAELMGEIESSPEMQAQFESIFKELGAAAAASGAGAGPADPLTASAQPSIPRGGAANPASSSAGASASAGEASFQETIRRTMERMQTSGEQATAAAAAGGSDDFMAELLRQMQAGGGDLGEGGEEEFSKMLLGMMEQLTNKDILYEPMKELNDKFPDWMSENRDKISEEDKKRYELQQELVGEIVARFEEPSYSDSNAEHREYIVDRMQKMQAAGSPPPDLVGDMPSAQDALGGPDAESCNPQ